jgi:peptidase E
MKTKFILHGGFNPGQLNEDNSDFYKEILKDAPKDAKILLVPFAKEADRAAISVDKITQEFNRNGGEKHISIAVANEEDFMRRLKDADVIYFHGGTSLKLLEALKRYPNLKEPLKGKIIAGESAGANVWSKFFYSPRADVVSEGLGLLPIKMIPHFKKEYEGKLDNIGEGLETVSLVEYQFRIFQL